MQALCTVGLVLIAIIGGIASTAEAILTSGDVLVGQDTVNDTGKLRQFAPDGAFLRVLDNGALGGEQTGMCWDRAGNLYTTNFLAFSLSKFSADGALVSATFIDVAPSTPNSCAFDAAGHLYVGLSDADAINFPGAGGGGLLKFDLAGGTPSLVAVFHPDIETRGTDWIDLAPDQCTMLYTSVGSSIKRFDVCANPEPPPAASGRQLEDYCTGCGDGSGEPTGPFLALRILIGGGGVLVADAGAYTVGMVRRYDGDAATGTGAHVRAYAGPDFFGIGCGSTGEAPCFFPFAMNLDPDGATFWTADYATSEVFRFALEGDATPVSGPFCGAEGCDFFHWVTGLAVVGELTAATYGKPEVAAQITAASKVYDGTTRAAITSCTLTGVKGADDVGCEASGAAFDGADVGAGKPVSATVALTGSAAGGYALSSSRGTTTADITPAPASVTPNAAAKAYGTPDPVLTGVLSGFVAGEGVTAEYSRTSGETVDGGPYTISAALSPAGVLGNYAVTYNTALFTIDRISASVTPNPASKTYGTDDPTLTGVVTGFLPADGVTARYTRTAGETVGGSPYAIRATLSPAAVLGNYAITYNTAAFAITPATPVVTWANPADITYPTPLGATQLNATADVPGTFAYSPPAGPVLSPGGGQLLSVVFTPTDNSDYTTASAHVYINVLATDVSVAGSTTTPVINAGELAIYSVTVTSTGAAAASGVVLADTLPGGLSWTVAGPDAGACTPGSPVGGDTALSCSFGALPAGSTRTITLSATTTTASCGTISNAAAVSAVGDTNAGNDSTGPVPITVNCPSLSIAKSTSTPTISAGATASYEISVAAGGTGNSTGVVLSDLLPSGLLWNVAGADAAACSPSSPVPGGTTLTCDFGTLAPGMTRNIVLTAPTTTANCGTISNTATVRAAADATSDYNSAGPVGIAVACPDVSVAVTTSTPVITQGSNAVYRVVVTGNGPGSATNVTLSDVLPAGLAWSIGGPDAAACSPTSPLAGGMTLTCGFGALLPGASRTITLTATTGGGNCGTISNMATVTAAGDTDAGNNRSASVDISVNCAPVAVTLSCPAVSLVHASLSVSGAVSRPGTGGPVTIQYTSPSGTSTSHVAQPGAAGAYADAFAPGELGPWTVRASWNGAISPVCPVVVFDKSAGGSFVIGDGDAVLGNPVEFWGAQWWKDNTLSGGEGSGSASFKGYADAVDLPSNCGGSWSTRPGNSSQPPSTIPSYMAVIVSSSVVKNGSTISGDVVAEVIVKTDPGYAGNPGHAGTGTIVAVRCRR